MLYCRYITINNGCGLQGFYDQMAQVLSSTTAISNWSPDLVAGPEWRSFEQFRVAGSAALESIASAVGSSIGGAERDVEIDRALRSKPDRKRGRRQAKTHTGDREDGHCGRRAGGVAQAKVRDGRLIGIQRAEIVDCGRGLLHTAHH